MFLFPYRLIRPHSDRENGGVGMDGLELPVDHSAEANRKKKNYAPGEQSSSGARGRVSDTDK